MRYYFKISLIKLVRKTILGIWENPEAILFNTDNFYKSKRGRFKVIEPFKRLTGRSNIEMLQKNNILIGQEPVFNTNPIKKKTKTEISTYDTFRNSCSKTFRQKYLFNNEHSTILFRKCFRINQIKKSLSLPFNALATGMAHFWTTYF